ncbi:NAD-dependent epimerase/dehydratase family protein [Demequina zhanjiangensis]|uniref:Reductase n=1 Tax=Demequina zhanjiangensis TaxID=3051659 RepID=A0ABT8G4C6_9MICO|nr:NAD-dependent epimerase/dehydratase family protein [Demequina sp. SYSU T00b26]MDN4473958.1 reductase [Demequina sp. SYSU T00b26]
MTDRPLQILVLGGTAWLGALTARTALARGHHVTCVARGVSGAVPEGAELVVADRDEPGAYDAVADRDWDAVVEVSWQPRHVREAAEALAGRARHWTYVSSVAAYAPVRETISEDGPLREPAAIDERVDGSRYDAAKARCEADTLASHPDALLVRAGVIGGPGDPTDRLAYWPRRAAQAGDGPMLVPAEPSVPVQVIDVRDLVAWMLDSIESGLGGAVNAVGEAMSMRAMIDLARQVAGAAGPVVEAPGPWLQEHGVRQWKGDGSMGLWVDDDGGPARCGYHSDSRYLATGGRRRPLAETLADVLDEERELGLGRPGTAGLGRARELELIGELAR